MEVWGQIITWIVCTTLIFLLIRVIIRGYFWQDTKGKKLSLKEFLSRWREGVQGISPLQQVKTSLWAFIPLFGGITWGIVITFIGKTYWLTAILCGSLPLTSIQFISTLQKYFSIKKVEEVMKELK